MGFALQVAEQERQPVPLGQPRNFFVQDRSPIVERIIIGLILDNRIADQSFAGFQASGISLGPSSDPIGDPVQPTPQCPSAADRPRLADEDQESRLKGILSRLMVPNYRGAGIQYHRPVSLDQGREGGVILFVEKPLQELSIR